MDVWTIGPLVLNEQMLLIAVAVAAGYAAMRLRLRQAQLKEKPADRFFEAMLLWIVVWKLSALLLHPQSMKDPSALLYFHGGSQGMILAAIAVAAYVWLRDQKAPGLPIYIDSWLVSILVGYTCYRIFNMLFLEGNTATDGLLVVSGAALAATAFMRRPQMEGRRVLTLALAFVIVHALISSVAASTWEKAGWGMGQALAEGEKTGIKLGQQAPDFTLMTLEGEPVKLSDFRGKKVVLNFWATWCPPCRAEMPQMQSFYQEFKDRNVVILSVNATHTEASRYPVQAFKNSWGLTFPVVLDTAGEVGKTYQVSAYPATYILDEQGMIRKKHPGALDQSMLEQAVSF